LVATENMQAAPVAFAFARTHGGCPEECCEYNASQVDGVVLCEVVGISENKATGLGQEALNTINALKAGLTKCGRDEPKHTHRGCGLYEFASISSIDNIHDHFSLSFWI
jgi:hypothetical protein